MSDGQDPSTTMTGITRSSGLTFIAILFAFIMKTTLDSFFKGIASYSTVVALVEAIAHWPTRSCLLAGQLLIFLFLLIRFYWGAFRYYLQKPQADEAPELAVDLLGSLVLFSSFYVVSLVIRNVTLFYVAVVLAHCIDFIWFLTAMNWLTLQDGMRKVAGSFHLFDVVTIVFLSGFAIGEVFGGPTKYFVYQWLSLATLFAVGVWDLKRLWPFYRDIPGWEDSLPRRVGKGK